MKTFLSSSPFLKTAIVLPYITKYILENKWQVPSMFLVQWAPSCIWCHTMIQRCQLLTKIFGQLFQLYKQKYTVLNSDSNSSLQSIEK